MQYILTEEEYNALRSSRERKIKLNEQKLQTLCTKIADEMPVKWGGLDPQPWGCIITAAEEDDNECYCDKCPVIEICPNKDKRWSQ